MLLRICAAAVRGRGLWSRFWVRQAETNVKVVCQ